MACAPSEDSDQSGHPPSLISVFVVRMKKAWVLSYPLSGQRRLWSDWVHSYFVDFVISIWILFVTSERGPQWCAVSDLSNVYAQQLNGASDMTLWSFSFSIYCVSEQRKLWCDCADVVGAPEPSLFAYLISTFSTWAGSSVVLRK